MREGPQLHVRLQAEAIDLAAAAALLQDPRAGGLTTFTGTVRDHNHGRQVLSLAYEAYPEMAHARMAAIAREIAERWPVYHVVLIHRIGPLAIGDAAVFVGIASAHRDVAFEACRYGIDAIKAEVPIWKKEVFVGGEVWVGGCASPHAG